MLKIVSKYAKYVDELPQLIKDSPHNDSLYYRRTSNSECDLLPEFKRQKFFC